MKFYLLFVFLAYIFTVISCDRILGVFPSRFVGHQEIFRVLTDELVNRGHEVVVITPHPAYPKGGGPRSLKEINIYNETVAADYNILDALHTGTSTDTATSAAILSVTKMQLGSELVIDLLSKENKDAFDLVIIDIADLGTLGIISKLNAPVIGFSVSNIYDVIWMEFGVSTHPIIYPALHATQSDSESEVMRFLDRLKFVWKYFRNNSLYSNTLKQLTKIWHDVLVTDEPSACELLSKVDLLFLNQNNVWLGSRPLPPSVVLIGSLQMKPQSPLNEEFLHLLNEADNGIVYFSLGSMILSKDLTKEKVQMFVDAFSLLPYHVFFKFDDEDISVDLPYNVIMKKWFPQGDMLGHPNIKAFITHCGQHSIDEAIRGHVPVVGVPFFFDQPMNAARIVHFGIGKMLDHETMTAHMLAGAVKEVINNPSYKRNIEKLDKLINDKPMKDLDHAIWWAEYLIRNKDAKLLRGPAAKVPMYQFLFLDVIAFTFLVLVVLILVFFGIYLYFKQPKEEKIKKS